MNPSDTKVKAPAPDDLGRAREILLNLNGAALDSEQATYALALALTDQRNQFVEHFMKTVENPVDKLIKQAAASCDNAFPVPFTPDTVAVARGLSKREYIATAAMMNLQNVCLRSSGHELIKMLRETKYQNKLSVVQVIAAEAFVFADAMLEESEKKNATNPSSETKTPQKSE